MDASVEQLEAEEDALWHELHDTVARFSAEEALRPGYFAEGWSAKDALAHVGTWLAEAGAALERMRSGGGSPPPSDEEIDVLNRRFHEAMRDVPLDVVKSQASAARWRMLHALVELPSRPPEAAAWVRKSGPDHYREHLPRLRSWLGELRSTA
jgi:hypothetical protein